MSIKVYITIDTEEDQWGEYVTTGASVDNVTMIPMLQQLFDRFGAIPTYLINYPVVINDKARQIIKQIYDDGRCGIGMHCHPWNTPPFEEELSNHNSMLCNLPYDLVYEKLRTLHRAIDHYWGVSPICFRAGRWGFGESVARCIYELGYKVDSSVSPFINWLEYGGPDYSNAPADQYLFNTENILSENSQGILLEVPPTIGFFQDNFHRCAWLRKWAMSSKLSKYYLIGILDKLRILNFRWLTPELCNGKDMIRLSRTFIRKGSRYLNMSFHSTSLVPGLGSFVRSENDLEKYLKNIELFLNYACENRFEFARLNEAVESKRNEITSW
jgi:hypothetical protein